MNRKIVCALLLIAFFLRVNAQKEIISTATGFLTAQKYAAANKYLDSVLKKHPNNTDALMMKGNVVLNFALDTTAPMQFITEDDESIYNNRISDKPKLLSRQSAYQVAKIWEKCLKQDSSRTDILKGLCTVYSMALMKDSLKKAILRLVADTPNDTNQVFNTCEYARNFKHRNRTDDAMDIYRFIAQQYPSVAGVRCDIASEYFYAGNQNAALLWLDSCYRAKNIDETSFLNGAFIYSLLGYFDDAQTVLSVYSKKLNRKMATFYYGLMLFSDSSLKYAPALEGFCHSVDSNSYFTEYSLAQKLLAYRDSFTLADYKALVEDAEIPDYYKGLIHYRAIKQFKNTCEPLLLYGILQSSIKNYPAAVQLLQEGETCQMKALQAEYWMFHYAFTLYRFGQKDKAMIYFKPLVRSTTAFTKQAAQYFLANILFEQNKKEEAKNIWQELATAKTETKYRALAKQQIR